MCISVLKSYLFAQSESFTFLFHLTFKKIYRNINVKILNGKKVFFHCGKSLFSFPDQCSCQKGIQIASPKITFTTR